MTFEGYLPGYPAGSDVVARGPLWFVLRLAWRWRVAAEQHVKIRRAR